MMQKLEGDFARFYNHASIGAVPSGMIAITARWSKMANICGIAFCMSISIWSAQVWSPIRTTGRGAATRNWRARRFRYRLLDFERLLAYWARPIRSPSARSIGKRIRQSI